jgi:hypothetical protein
VPLDIRRLSEIFTALNFVVPCNNIQVVLIMCINERLQVPRRDTKLNFISLECSQVAGQNEGLNMEGILISKIGIFPIVWGTLFRRRCNFKR